MANPIQNPLSSQSFDVVNYRELSYGASTDNVRINFQFNNLN
jgi:hypothetical protein